MTAITARQRQPETRPDFLTIREAMDRTGLSRQTLWRLWKRGDMPQPVTLCGRMKAFDAAEFNGWLDRKREERERTGQAE